MANQSVQQREQGMPLCMNSGQSGVTQMEQWNRAPPRDDAHTQWHGGTSHCAVDKMTCTVQTDKSEDSVWLRRQRVHPNSLGWYYFDSCVNRKLGQGSLSCTLSQRSYFSSKEQRSSRRDFWGAMSKATQGQAMGKCLSDLSALFLDVYWSDSAAHWTDVIHHNTEFQKTEDRCQK